MSHSGVLPAVISSLYDPAGRDGWTHNMLENIHSHWKRKRVCKIKCKGVCTVVMDNVCQQVEVFSSFPFFLVLLPVVQLVYVNLKKIKGQETSIERFQYTLTTPKQLKVKPFSTLLATRLFNP